MLLNALLILPPLFHTIRFASKQVYSKFAKKSNLKILHCKLDLLIIAAIRGLVHACDMNLSGLQTQKYEAMPCQTLSLTHTSSLHHMKYSFLHNLGWLFNPLIKVCSLKKTRRGEIETKVVVMMYCSSLLLTHPKHTRSFKHTHTLSLSLPLSRPLLLSFTRTHTRTHVLTQTKVQRPELSSFSLLTIDSCIAEYDFPSKNISK